ncbi:MAG TPA: DUF3209 family protein [Kofleriaceae bacterium]|jgi:hypothetical protein
MACHEIAALRLGLMTVLGHDDPAERQHELAELGDGADRPGPLRAMCQATDLGALKRCYEASIAALEHRVAMTSADDPGLPYLRTLVVLARKVELDLGHQIDGLHHLYRDLEAMHDFVHEIYPAPEA